MGQKIADERASEPLVLLCHVVALESYQHSTTGTENNGQSEQLCWAQGSDFGFPA